MYQSLLLLALILLSHPELVSASKQYRCYGMVQYRPCDPNPPPERPAMRRRPDPRAHFNIDTANLKYAKVLSSNLKKVSAMDGVWGGRVEGNGTVHLELQIYRGGALESKRYMGHVPLKNKSTAFRFRSVMPNGPAWSWKIVASAT